MKASFSIPFIESTSNSWGPPSISTYINTDDSTTISAATNQTTTTAAAGIGKFASLPYAPFGRSDRLGRAADFINPNPQSHYSQNRSGNNNNNNNSNNIYRDGYNHSNDPNETRAKSEDNENDAAFQLVDTSKGTSSSGNNYGGGKKFVNPAAKRRQHSIRLRQINARRQQSAGGSAIAGLEYRMVGGGRGSGGGGPGRGGPGMGGRGGPGAAGAGRGSTAGGYYTNRIDRQPSVAVQPEWKLLEDIDLSKLTKNLTASTTVPKVQDIVWCGFLDVYNELYDKVSARQPVPLKRMEHKEFYPVTTTDDPVLEKLAVDGVGQVFITDTILAHLMTCTRSVYPWDIVVTKLPGNIFFFDKRDNSTFDYLTVQETAYAQPQPMEDEYGNNVNTPERLGLEATMINQNFSQQIVKKAGRQNMDLPNPFFDEDDEENPKSNMEPASVAFRYRSFALEPDMTVVCRTELHGLVKKTQYMTAFCLNEFSSNAVPGAPSATQLSWRDKIDNQRGAVLANELKNNSFKFAKWTAQSILAGADQMKIGFVSRTNPKNSNEHVILGTQFYRPTDFAQQITLQEGQMWCMFRTFIAMIQKHKSLTDASATSKYVIMRDPNKPILRLYQVPPETFDDPE
jgi:translation initiation factor 3 subunit D